MTPEEEEDARIEREHEERRWLTSGEWLKLWFHSSEVGLRTERKTRLFAVAACRRFMHRLVDPRCRRAVEVCEAYADGQASAKELRAACDGAKFDDAPPAPRQQTAVCRAAAGATHWICYAEYKVGRTTEAAPSVHGYEALIAAGLMDEDDQNAPDDERSRAVFDEGHAKGERIQADILREVIGNPFRPVALDPAWPTDTVLALARQMYDARDFGAMPILADALQDAGCDSADVLDHCRDASAVHVRGCWVVDLLLGKK
jgi:hypothetical protein